MKTDHKYSIRLREKERLKDLAQRGEEVSEIATFMRDSYWCEAVFLFPSDLINKKVN